MKSTLAKDYVVTKIDVDEMTHGKKVAERLRGKDAKGGIPWMTILDENGARLITSDGPKGNIGCPVAAHEVDWFMQMLEKTASRMTEEDQAVVRIALVGFGKK